MSWEHVGIALFTFAIVCEQAHVVSPIILAWTHQGLRQIALSRPIETMLLPVIAIVGMLAMPFFVALPFWPYRINPDLLVYGTWNTYHFGAQHYGVSRICGWRVPKWFCVSITAALMSASLFIHTIWFIFLYLVAIGFNHWLIDIGLSSRVSRYWWLFIIAVLPLGCVGFKWLGVCFHHEVLWWHARCTDEFGIATLAVPWIIKARWGVGIAHFLYSRWVWKLSDPQVRAAIGADLFSKKAGTQWLGSISFAQRNT